MSKEQGQEGRLLLAVALSILLLWGWFKVFPPPKPEPPAAPAPSAIAAESGVESSPEAAVPQEQAEAPSLRPDAEAAALAETLAASYREKTADARPAESVAVETNFFRAAFSPRGARLESLKLLGHLDAERKPLELVYAGIPEALPFGLEIHGRPERAKEANGAFYVADLSESEDGGAMLALTYASEDGAFAVRKTFWFTRDAYPFKVQADVIENGARLDAHVYLGAGFGMDEASAGNRFTIHEAIFGLPRGASWEGARAAKTDIVKAARKPEPGHLTGLVFKELPYENMGGDTLRLPYSVGWTAAGDNYFAAVMLPHKTFSDARLKVWRKEFPPKKKGGKPVLVETAAVGVPASELESVAYIPKESAVLASLGRGVETLVDWGIFWWLALPLRWLLSFFHGYVGNYGLAIILVTFIVKILFHPLTHKGMVSMRRMQKLQPKISVIREKYRKKKDMESRQKMNQEVMDLYKREGVNPMGGCLPLLLQMPVLWAFYQVLQYAIEMRQAPFFLWINDLSLPDPYFVTPIVMGVTMFIQQKMSQPPATDSAQEFQMKLMRWMPAFFTYLFLYFPSGLVLYWLTNNVLSIVQQRWINRAADAADGKGKPKKEKKKKDEAAEEDVNNT